MDFVVTLYEYITKNSPATTKKQALLVTKAKSALNYQECCLAANRRRRLTLHARTDRDDPGSAAPADPDGDSCRESQIKE